MGAKRDALVCQPFLNVSFNSFILSERSVLYLLLKSDQELTLSLSTVLAFGYSFDAHLIFLIFVF